MPCTVDALAAFFDAYAARVNRALVDPPDVDVEATAAAFAECFLGANPQGVRCGANDAAFREAIPQGFAFYRSIGTQRMEITALDVTALDAGHALATVDWSAHYRRRDGRELSIEFSVIYLVQLLGDAPLIFCYITGDEEAAYREHGLMPE